MHRINIKQIEQCSSIPSQLIDCRYRPCLHSQINTVNYVFVCLLISFFICLPLCKPLWCQLIQVAWASLLVHTTKTNFLWFGLISDWMVNSQWLWSPWQKLHSHRSHNIRQHHFYCRIKIALQLLVHKKMFGIWSQLKSRSDKWNGSHCRWRGLSRSGFVFEMLGKLTTCCDEMTIAINTTRKCFIAKSEWLFRTSSIWAPHRPVRS